VSITFACPCGKKVRARASSAGRSFDCPSCGMGLEVPLPSAIELGIRLDPSDPFLIPSSSAPGDHFVMSPQPVASVPATESIEPPSPSFEPIKVKPAPYLYKMIQMAQSIEVQEGKSHRRVAADYLENIVNKMAVDGWEFYRIDSIGITVAPGCLGSLFNQSPRHVSYYVATFRRLSELP
jgi:hypothetical protein